MYMDSNNPRLQHPHLHVTWPGEPLLAGTKKDKAIYVCGKEKNDIYISTMFSSIFIEIKACSKVQYFVVSMYSDPHKTPFLSVSEQ